MKVVTLFILIMIIGIVLLMLNDERKRAIKQLEEARGDVLDAELENGRKEFALQLINEEHRQEAAELRARLEDSERQKRILIAVVDIEREKRREAEGCRNLRI